MLGKCITRGSMRRLTDALKGGLRIWKGRNHLSTRDDEATWICHVGKTGKDVFVEIVNKWMSGCIEIRSHIAGVLERGSEDDLVEAYPVAHESMPKPSVLIRLRYD
jgi:hypothetical protein